MYDEPFLINPPRRKKRKSSGKRRRKASSGGRKRRRRPVKTVVVHAAPKRRRRRKAGVRRRRRSASSYGRKHRPVVYGSGRTWRRSKAYRKRRKHKHLLVNPGLALIGNRPRRRRRSNPVSVVGLKGQLMGALPLAVTGIASGVATSLVPGYLNLSNQWMNYGVKAGVALFGGQMVGKFVGKDHGLIWTVAGLSILVKDLVQQYLPGVIPGLGYTYPSYYEAPSVGAYPQEMGAFPGEDYQYPDTGAYANMGESPYPY